METNQTCKTCKFYIQHYASLGISFKPLGYGHCVVKKRKMNSVAQTAHCELWECGEEKRQAKIESVEQALICIANHLKEITKYYEQITKDPRLNE